ncbi:Hypp4495 [Branchiostoma lanceolatum]|uniref:Hypp4495 protein n=1 Tax=Branchiostoma lanceolatum TaxID=7740 RepID=A0A8K0EYN0_BRALA|nr:Hypp4495 [Branchiostoma lanceolatum]
MKALMKVARHLRNIDNKLRELGFCEKARCLLLRKRSTAPSDTECTQDSWLSCKVDEIQKFADCNNTKRFYDGLKEKLSDSALWNLATAYCRLDRLTRARFRKDGRLFNLQGPKAKAKVKETPVRYFLFADDSALNAATEATMQWGMD